MNIKEAKEEILHTIQIYTRKDAHGQYLMPSVRQRPVLLIGPPGIGKTAIMEQISRECGIGLTAYTITAPHPPECRRPSRYRKEKLSGQRVFHHRIYDE